MIDIDHLTGSFVRIRRGRMVMIRRCHKSSVNLTGN